MASISPEKFQCCTTLVAFFEIVVGLWFLMSKKEDNAVKVL